MQENYGRDLDLNLLRVFCVVADAGSVTTAAGRLYLTQPAVSAALRRLTEAVGAPLFVRQGRRLKLSSRGQQLRVKAQSHLAALIEAALSPEAFVPARSDRIVRLGLSDSAETWLLPRLLGVLSHSAPGMRLVSVPIQFRNVVQSLTSGAVEMAVTVADEMPAAVHRRSLFWGDFVCLFDGRHVELGSRMTERQYFEHEHVIVSYNADLRGIVEDVLKKSRKTRCSVSSFSNVAAIVEGSALLATVPRLVAAKAVVTRPHLRMLELPIALDGASTDLLWPAATDDDEACRFVRDRIVELVADVVKTTRVARVGGGGRARSKRR